MSDSVLYMRNEKMSASEDEFQENIWDDTLLIQAYNRAVNSAKEKVASKLNLENGVSQESTSPQVPASNSRIKKSKKNSPAQNNEAWTVGMFCRCTYSEDGVEYEAVVQDMNLRKGICRVKYIGYNNEEDVNISELKPSYGPEARRNQEMLVQFEANQQNTSLEAENNSESYQCREQGMIPPPPPPHVMAHFPKDESDALSAMLMAWYMSGYHTGYYQGLTKAKTNSHLKTLKRHFK
ncbi:hypothetical protein O3M35_008122 [Rhynocoris fuscipes]|uniref:Tudor domain-containing protein n=1 Tax=Rhynocoris fuscipes TaxID=488301 RepID=A0AAW1D5W3_9HEMI